MICINCNKIPTSNPDHICGICRLKDMAAHYSAGSNVIIKDFVSQIPKGAQEQSKQEYLDWTIQDENDWKWSHIDR